MKKKLNPVSPFLILLVPALLVLGSVTANPAKEEVHTEKYKAGACFTLPAFRGLIQSLF